MLIAALALLLQQATPPPPALDDEILVVGRRIRNMRFAIRADRRRGGYRCIVKRSSGDPALDTAICDIGLDCVRDATSAQQVEGCVKPRLAALPGLYAAEKQRVSVDPSAR